jgi:hypothetical protein
MNLWKRKIEIIKTMFRYLYKVLLFLRRLVGIKSPIVAYTKPTNRTTDKEEIIAFANQYLQKDSWLDMNGFIWGDMMYDDAPTSFILDIAKRMERTGDYIMDTQDVTGRYLIYALPKKLLRDKSPLLYQIIVVCITVAITTIAGYIVQLTQHQEQRLKDYQQDEHLKSLSDSVKKIQTEVKELKDTTKRK